MDHVESEQGLLGYGGTCCVDVAMIETLQSELDASPADEMRRMNELALYSKMR